ncbi:MAG: PAS domain-containing protein [Nitrospirales bacterium]|nr:PAS domain-containing protein [Nitrospira sp.]MDR4501396.1 PAS domain-containing protein [Nitrospirales bacterium]
MNILFSQLFNASPLSRQQIRRIQTIIVIYLLPATCQWLVGLMAGTEPGGLSSWLKWAYVVFDLSVFVLIYFEWVRVGLFLTLGSFCLLTIQMLSISSSSVLFLVPGATNVLLIAFLSYGVHLASLMAFLFVVLMAGDVAGNFSLLVYHHLHMPYYWGIVGLGVATNVLFLYCMRLWSPNIPILKVSFPVRYFERFNRIWKILSVLRKKKDSNNLLGVLPGPLRSSVDRQASQLLPILFVSLFNHLVMLWVGHYGQMFLPGEVVVHGIAIVFLLLIFLIVQKGRWVLIGTWGFVIYASSITLLLGWAFGVLNPVTMPYLMGSIVAIGLLTTWEKGFIIGGTLLGLVIMVMTVTGQSGALHISEFESVRGWAFTLCLLDLLLVVLHTHYRSIQQALKEREFFEVNYKQLLASAPLGIVVTMQDGSVVEANEAARQLLAVSSDPSFGSKFHLNARLQLGVDYALTQRASHVFEAVIPAHDFMSHRHLQVHCSPLFTGSKGVDRCQLMLVDCTELRDKERALQQQLSDRERINQYLDDGILLRLIQHAQSLRNLPIFFSWQAREVTILGLEKGLQEVETIMKDIRKVLSGLSIPTYQGERVGDEFQEAISHLSKRYNMSVHFERKSSFLNCLEGTLGGQIVELLREMLEWFRKEGLTHHMRVHLWDHEEFIAIEIEGYPTEPVLVPVPVSPDHACSNGQALGAIKQKTYRLHGVVIRDDLPDGGNILKVRFPLPRFHEMT